MPPQRQFRSQTTRRQVIQSLLGGSLVMPGIVSELMAGGTTGGVAPREPHHRPKAKRVIFIYLSGGMSHLDSFDRKPALIKAADDGQIAKNGRRYVRPQWDWKKYGESRVEVSDLFPHIGACMDDLCLIRSMNGNHSNHVQATLGLHSGSFSVTRPSIGSWVSYGLGTENNNLPSFVVLAPRLPYAGSQVWGSEFLPAEHQGARIIDSENPIPNVARLTPTPRLQEMELGLLDKLNRRHLKKRPSDPRLAARMKSFETAFGMQMEVPDVFDLSKESDATHNLYGLKRGSTSGVAWQCIVARRMAERGVRFIELIDRGSNNNWDAHINIRSHETLARKVDRPVAGLLKDLKLRGMLDDTLVVFTTEFGRSPWEDGNNGRSHHAGAFSSWIAGGGVKPGIVHGKTDDFGVNVVEDKVHTHDFHATILHLLGFDHERLTYRHGGRDFRLTDVSGKVVKGILA